MADEAKIQQGTPTPVAPTPVSTGPAKPAETTAATSADTTSTAKSSGGLGEAFGGMMPMLVGMMLIFYFLLIRPEKKRREAQLALLTAMKEGDAVVTTSGIYGNVSKIDGDDIVLVIDTKKDVRMRVRKDAVTSIMETKK